MVENLDDKSVLLEHLRQFNDTLLRLVARRRRVRAERRLRIARAKSGLMFALALGLILLAAALSVFFLPIFAIDSLLWVIIVLGILFVGIACLLVKIARQNSIDFGKRPYVQKRLADLDSRLQKLDVEIVSLMSVDFVNDLPIDAKYVDKQMLQEAADLLAMDETLSWIEITRELDKQAMLQRVRRQSLFAAEWFRLFGANYPDKVRL